MALSLIILSIIAASFALGVSFADIRAEVRQRIDARKPERNVARSYLSEVLPDRPANANRPGCRTAA